MYRRYSINTNAAALTVGATAHGCIALISAATVRPYIYDWTIGTTGTPADNVMTVNIARITNATAGTSSTSATPIPLDSVDSGLASTGASAWTTEPTVGVCLFNVGQNQRATYRWVAAPGGELVCAATANSGITIQVSSPGYTSTCAGTLYYAE